MKTHDEKIIYDMQKIHELSQSYNLSSQKEVDALYMHLKKQKQHIFLSWLGRSFFQVLSTKTTNARRRRRVAAVIRYIEAAAFSAAIFLIGVGILYKIKEHENMARQEVLWEIKVSESISAIDNSESATSAFAEAYDILEEYRKFSYINPDFVGWLTIYGTEIDYPVLQNKQNPQFYLSHNFLGEEQYSGSIFLDGAASTCPPDDNIVLYGHNMADGTMFGSLQKYKEEAFFLEHPEFEFDTCYEKNMYQIVAVVIADISDTGDFCYYHFRNYDSDSFQKFISFVDENKLFDTNMPINYGDSFIMLSTCEGTSKNSRLIIIGQKLP